LKVLIASSSLLAIPLFNELGTSKAHEILGLLTNPDKPTGRGQKIGANDLALWAEENDFATYKPSNSAEIESIISELKPDLVITIAYGQLIKKTALTIPSYGWINIHFSALPKWRGAAPVQHAIMQGESQTGVSIFKLDEGMDTGPVYITKLTDIDATETTSELLQRLSLIGAEMTPQVLEMIKAGEEAMPQQLSGVSLAPKINKNDGKIQWQAAASQIHNHFRALKDNPGVWCNLGENRIKIDGLKITDLFNHLEPGQVLIENEKLIVGTKDMAIELLRITPAGRNSMTAAEFIRGLSVKDGLYLG
jgi:methionyl-tRNA formyltransferase